MIDRCAYNSCRQRVFQAGYRFSYRAGLASVWQEIFRGSFDEVEEFVRAEPCRSVPLTAMAPRLNGCVSHPVLEAHA